MTKLSACETLIQTQLRTNGIIDQNILDIYQQIPREAFVPKNYQPFAYTDQRIPLEFGQCMLTPLEEALLLQSLNLKGTERVLEVGTGQGFLTAMLSRLCKHVYSVDYFPSMTQNARNNLTPFAINNIELFTGDASQCWDSHAPYDVVIYTGALSDITETHRLQIFPGGQLIAFIGDACFVKAKHYSLDHNKQWHEKTLFETSLPCLITPKTRPAFVF